MTSAKSKSGSNTKTGEKPISGQSKPAAGATGGPSRGPNKVPFAAENIEHEIRRAMREKEKKRSKNPGLYI